MMLCLLIVIINMIIYNKYFLINMDILIKFIIINKLTSLVLIYLHNNFTLNHKVLLNYQLNKLYYY